MKRTIYLHGHLKDLYPEPIEVEAESVAEAVRSLQSIPELAPQDGRPHPVRVDGIDSQVALFSQSDMDEIHVHPLAGGAGGRGGFFQILLGIVLIAVAVLNPGLAMFGDLITASSLFSAGAMMVAGGLLQLLMPTPDDNEQESSKYLGAVKNTAKIGTPIPIIYGSARVGGHYLSFDVDAFDDYTGDDDPGLSINDILLDPQNWLLDITDPEVVEVAPEDEDETLKGTKFRVHDRPTPAPAIAVVNPIYASQTPGAGNIPTSGWIR